MLDVWSGCVRGVADETLTIVIDAPVPGIIVKTDTKTATGSVTVTFGVNTSALDGAANAATSAGVSSVTHTTTFAAGDTITLTNSAASTAPAAADLYYAIHYLRPA